MAHGKSLIMRELDLEMLTDLLRSLGIRKASALIYRLTFRIGTRREFYKDLSSVLRSQIRIETAILDLWHSRSLPDHVAKPILGRIRRGKHLTVALEGIVPDQERMVIKSGEEGEGKDSLWKALHVLSESVESMQKGQSSALKSAAYPFAILVGVVGFSIFYSKKMIAQFVSGHMIHPERLHGTSLFEYDTFMVLDNYWSVFLVALLVGILFVSWSLSHIFPGRNSLERFPPWSLYRLWTGAQFLFALSALMKSGVPLLRGLTILMKGANPYVAQRLRTIRSGVSVGQGLARSMARSPYRWPDPRIIARLQIREEHADIVEALDEFSRDWKERGDEMIQAQTKLLGVVLFIIITILMAVVAVGPYALEGQAGQGMNGF